MIPSAAADPVAGYLEAVEAALPDRVVAVYIVGGVALADFSVRQSNLDLVVVCDPPLDATEEAAVRRAERHLVRASRAPAVWYAGWDVIADGPSSSGPSPAGRSELDTPLTRALLQEEAVAYTGPDWPVVAYEEGEYRDWCRRRLEDLVEGDHGLLVMRHDVSPLVLQAARLALGAATGRVYSKSEAGEAGTTLVPPHFRRILHDAAGYRNGANTSMYWGPFERKYDARQLLRALRAAVVD